MTTGMCKDCLKGSIHEGETQGEVTKVHGFDTYVAHPKTATGTHPAIIVLLPDGLGWEGPNLRLTADRYAQRTGCTVYLPDLMDGRSLPLWAMNLPIEDIIGNWTSPMVLLMKPYYIFWAIVAMIPFRMANGFPKSHPRVVKFFTALRKSEEAQGKLVGVAGFCWGGKHGFMLGADKTAEGGHLIDFAFVGHPATVELPREIDELECPISVAMGTEDFMNSRAFSERMKGLLEQKTGRAAGSELIFYEGGNHGFACRADLKNDRLRECAEESEDHFVRWTKKMVDTLKPGANSAS
ncbi:hypothetical protein ABW20_dc0107409 [Dactylellina cionopaga]|nr:hypothetical protein ABW20_dc0107409 [Dactylellina cionopaga]